MEVGQRCGEVVNYCIRELVCSVGGGESKEMGAQAGVGVESRGVGSVVGGGVGVRRKIERKMCRAWLSN